MRFGFISHGGMKVYEHRPLNKRTKKLFSYRPQKYDSFVKLVLMLERSKTES
jgi:hypothetical protein